MLTKDQVLRLAESIQGWCTRPELEWLYYQAVNLPAGGVWVEVGTWKGRSLCPVLFGVPSLSKVISVDTFAGNPKSPTHFEASLMGGHWIRDHANLLISMVNALRLLPPELHGAISESVEAARSIESSEKKVDVVYLDADYRDSESIREQIKAWKKVLSTDGMLCGRNYGLEPPFVTEAVRELLPNFKRGLDSIWYWKEFRVD